MTVYPNPIGKGDGLINVQFKTKRSILQFEVINITGTVVKKLELEVESNTTNTIQIMLDDLPSGSYYIRMEGSEHVKTFIIQE